MWAAKEMAAIARWQGQPEQAEEYQAKAAQMEAAVTAHGWDGAWFLRAYDHFGHKVGSHECEEGRIYVEPQGLCPMAGVGVGDGSDLAEKAVAAVHEHLSTSPSGFWAFARRWMACGLHQSSRRTGRASPCAVYFAG